MSTRNNNTVTVKILDKEYQVACPPDEQNALLTAARELDGRMRAIRQSGNVIGLERIAVMAALNLSYELLSNNNAPAQSVSSEALQRLCDKLDNTLNQIN